MRPRSLDRPRTLALDPRSRTLQTVTSRRQSRNVGAFASMELKPLVPSASMRAAVMGGDKQ